MARRVPLLLGGGGGGSSEIAWVDLLDADRDAALDTDPSGLVTSYSQTDGLWSVTYTQTGTARDGIREGWLRRWDIPAPYAADERDIILTQIYDITFADTNSAAVLSCGLVTGTTIGTLAGEMCGIFDASTTDVRVTRTISTSTSNGNLFARAGARSDGRYMHQRASLGSTDKRYGVISASGISDAGAQVTDANLSSVLDRATTRMGLLVGSVGTGTLTGTITFRARYAHLRGPAWS